MTDKKETPADYEVTIEAGGKKTEVIVSPTASRSRPRPEEKKEKK